MLNVDQQEEVAGTITLKKDGTPEYGEVAFSTEQTMVRYRLNIEEDGQYYFGLIKDWNVSAYVSLFERTDEETTICQMNLTAMSFVKMEIII